MSAPPLISIVVACKNPGLRLRAALGSIWEQNHMGVEVIVIDGASTDGTREWLESQRNRLGAFLSEPDTGAYAAMNKGVKLARGEWLLFLGADDRLATSDVLSRVAPRLNAGTAHIFVGEAAFDDGRVYRLADRPRIAARNFVHHQATFYSRACFADRSYDETLRMQADYDFNLRLWCAGARFAPLPLRVAECASGGLSDSGCWQNYREEITVRHRHLPSRQCWPWDLGSLIRWTRKTIIRRVSRHG